MKQHKRSPIRAVLGLAAVALLALPSAASATPTLTVTASPDSVEVPGGVVTYTVTLNDVRNPPPGFDVTVEQFAMTDGVRTLYECYASPSLGSRGPEVFYPGARSRVLCSFDRLVTGAANSSQMLTVTAGGSEWFTRFGDKPELSSPESWTVSGAAEVHIKGEPRKPKCRNGKRAVRRKGSWRCVPKLHRGRGSR